MNTTQPRQLVAGWIGVVGAALGLVAGALQATIGAQIPQWSGDKSSPFQLGILTAILALIALAGGVALSRASLRTPQLLAASLSLLIPGLLCFTTVGILWYLPGGLLLAATLCAIISGDSRQSRRFVGTHWLAGLISVTGLLELMLALGSGSAWIAVIGIAGGLLVVVAPWVRSRVSRMPLLIAGSLPFAILTWWSISSPLLAVIALGLGGIMSTRREASPPPQGAAPLADT